MIIDVHAHWGPWFFSTAGGDLDENVRVMGIHGIDVQLVSAVEAVVYDPSAGNAALAEALVGQSRLRGMLVIDPRDLATAESDLEAHLHTGLFVGAKIHTHYAGTPAGAPAMADALRLLTDAGLPVLVHTWGQEIVDLGDVVARIDGARVIAAHLGGPAWRLVPEAAGRSDRLWFDPCWSMPVGGRIRWVIDQIGADRLVFGSDATLIDPAVTLGSIDAARLDPAELAMIMHGNALRIFGTALSRDR